jgi:subtilisin family serine protease
MKYLLALLALIAAVLCADYQILFKEQVDLDNLQHPFTHQSLSELSFETKGRVVFHTLKQTAELTQRHIRDELERRGYKYTPYWIYNTIIVNDADEDLIEYLRNRDEVASITRVPQIRVPLERGYDVYTEAAGPEWNVKMLKAPELWAKGIEGQGILVGVLDTGVNAEHKDLAPKYRGYKNGQFDHDYNWFDGVSGKKCKDAPCDQHGHGSHVSGTILGSNDKEQVGVAPKAQFIACRSFATGSATIQDILNCFQFFLAPTKRDGSSPNPDKRPHLVSNSWGSTQQTTAFDKAIEALTKVGVLNVFAAGNSGSRCSTMGWPGALEQVFTVAALGHQSKSLAYFSSRGPVPGKSYVKPNIAAPGQNIRSCSNVGDQYKTMSGTSMATPAISGTIALLWSARPELIGKLPETMKIMQDTAEAIKSTECNSPQDHPNYLYGWGLADPMAAINKY